jgi:DNA primase
VIERAKELLQQLMSQIPEPSQITEDLMQSVRANEIIEYRGLPAGPAIHESDKIIVVEGRADVINLLKHGVRNVIGMDGTSVPQAIIDLSREKEVTALLDGDRGGDLILKELLERADVDYVARAPKGKEVEELTKKEIFKALREAIPAEEVRHNLMEHREAERTREQEKQTVEQIETTRETRERKRTATGKRRIEMNEEIKSLLINEMNELIGTRAASIFDEDMNFVGRVPIKELENALNQVERAGVLLIDGYVDNELANLARKKGVGIIVANENKTRGRQNIVIITRKELTENA